jgi:hypothetical protein
MEFFGFKLNHIIMSDVTFQFINEKGDSTFKCLNCQRVFYTDAKANIKNSMHEICVKKFSKEIVEMKYSFSNSLDGIENVYIICSRCESKSHQLDEKKIFEKRLLRYCSGNNAYNQRLEKLYDLQPGMFIFDEKYTRRNYFALYTGVIISNLRKSREIILSGVTHRRVFYYELIQNYRSLVFFT